MEKLRAGPMTRKRALKAGLVLLLGVLLVAILYLANRARTIETDTVKIGVVVDAFMVAAADRDVEQMLALFAPEARSDELRDSMAATVQGDEYVLFDAYESVDVQRVEIGPFLGAEVRGTVARANGVVIYTNGFTGEFAADLLPDGAEWDLYNIRVRVPPEKRDADLGGSGNAD